MAQGTQTAGTRSRLGGRPTSSAPTRGGLSAEAKIDICRGLFAFLVVAAHGFDICRAIHPEGFVAMPVALNRLIYFTAENGIYWVMGFFVISGYCIHLSVERLMTEERFPVGAYLIARGTRILPLYYAALFFAVVVEALIDGNRPDVWPLGIDQLGLTSQFLVVQNFIQTYGSFAPSWSITNEICYYLFYGLLACVGRRRRAWPAWVGMVICMVIASLTQALYASTAPTHFILSTGLLFGLGINWFIGALIAVYARPLARSRFVRIGSLAWIPLLGGVFYLGHEQVLPGQALFLVCGVAFGLMLLRFLSTAPEVSATEAKATPSAAIRVLGLASYPTYLFHGPLIMLLASAQLRWHIIADWRLTWLLLTLAGILFGTALGYLVERPMMAWRALLLRQLKAPRTRGAEAIPAPVLSVQQ
jgi:peptidoglycan/LPS O-acetylase OafA/YrhL